MTRVGLGTPLGKRLLASRVPVDDLILTTIRVWPLRGALTVANPNGRATIFCPGAWLRNQDGFAYAFRHEFVHVAQARRWGFWGYWRNHIAARIRSRSMLAPHEDVEIEAYEIQRQFLASR